jgi:hypothetical protein
MFTRPEIERILEVFIYEQNRLQTDDPVYFTYINQMTKANLSSLSNNDIGTIRGFLFGWGHMGRTGIKPAIPKTRNIIQRYADFLQKARRQQLHASKLTPDKMTIEDLFEELNALVGRVSAAKILHLICPEFFPLWDTDILEGYNSSYKARHGSKLIQTKSVPTPKGKKEVVTGEGYYMFMGFTREFIATYHQRLSEIQTALNAASKYGKEKGLLKIVDEFNVHASHTPFCYLM